MCFYQHNVMKKFSKPFQLSLFSYTKKCLKISNISCRSKTQSNKKLKAGIYPKPNTAPSSDRCQESDIQSNLGLRTFWNLNNSVFEQLFLFTSIRVTVHSLLRCFIVTCALLLRL